ncbi:leucine-rich repeat protein [Artemisia annua]|uniref:Leucine-rich repeat protein n=1 Tax=Artemisia annua TaxID=35608 RepID=A0A2U1KQW2_ARTAN|nr:leucine-rich repeat protein [Artemisia annua]
MTGHVHHIHLRALEGHCQFVHEEASKQKLKGDLSPSLLDLKQLKHLDLSCNDFGWIQVPEFIGSLGNLRYLNLSSSNFGGIIPPQLGNISELHTLALGSFQDNYYESRAEHRVGTDPNRPESKKPRTEIHEKPKPKSNRRAVGSVRFSSGRFGFVGLSVFWCLDGFDLDLDEFGLSRRLYGIGFGFGLCFGRIVERIWTLDLVSMLLYCDVICELELDVLDLRLWLFGLMDPLVHETVGSEHIPWDSTTCVPISKCELSALNSASNIILEGNWVSHH